MADLRALLARRQFVSILSKPLPDQPRVVRVAQSIVDRGGTETKSFQKDYNRIASALKARCDRGQALEQAELRDAAWCLWETDPALVNTSAIAAILASFDASSRKRGYRALASSFVSSFDFERAGIEEVARVLAKRASEAGRPWHALHDLFEFFNVKRGPQKIAAAAISENASPTTILARYGLGSLDSKSGYAKACESSLLRQIANDKGLSPDRRLELVTFSALADQRTLNFQEHAPLVANALVLPFGQAIPESKIRDKYLQTLLALFGDPRLHPGQWTRMREAEVIVKRWLIRVSLLQFLDVVDEVAVERMWRYRRAFWEAVYREDIIQDAWVVLDRKGAYVAEDLFGRELSFASFDRGVEKGQAVLLLKIGRGLVAEWSHNGKCIIWDDISTSQAPRLYQEKYNPDDLRQHSENHSPDAKIFAISHHSPQSYRWQRKVTERIRRMTGVRLSESQFAVR